MWKKRYDVAIVGGGQAGLTLARHLLLETGKSVLLLDRRAELPAPHQKVGESTVQIAGYYLSKVLDLEKHLFDHHYMKYNLRFYWPAEGDGHSFERYGQSYIRNFSNIASFQIDRNVFEAEVLRLNRQHPRFTARLGVKGLQISLAEAEDEPHRLSFEADGETHDLEAAWVVDTTGRGKLLARREKLTRPNPIDHGAFFWWVDGLVDVEALSDASRKENRLRPSRRHLGHLPGWMATNHFCAEGMWFWVIPLRDRTSLGLVYDNALISPEEVFSVERATDFICRRFPLFARDLPHRTVLDHGGFRSFSHDCGQTLSAERWAMSGEAGRFSDPLYSPGSDLIAIHNTLIVDAIEASPDELESKCQLHEQLMKVIFQAYLPTYSVSYDTLGDQECFSLKYTWELTTYFAVFVFPFINDLYTDRRFALGFLRLFTRLGAVNGSLQRYLSAFYQWKKESAVATSEPVFFDFTEVCTLRRAADTFFDVGLTVAEAKRIQNEQAEGMRELARFIATYIASRVLGEPEALTNRSFVASFDIENLDFDPEAFRASYAACADDPETHGWTLDATVFERFRTLALDPSTRSTRTASKEAS